MRNKSTPWLGEAEGMENDLGTFGVSGDPLRCWRLLWREWSGVQHMQLVRDTETTGHEVSQ